MLYARSTNNSRNFDMKYIDAERLICLLDAKYKDFIGKAKIKGYTTLQYQYMADGIDIAEQLIDSLQQEQSDKESLNESQRELVNIVTERMLKEGPIPTLKGKQKAEFEKEFNRFKQITGMINFPAHMEIYKKIILWFMAWGADNLPNLNKVTNSDEFDFQQEQPDFPTTDEQMKEFLATHPKIEVPEKYKNPDWLFKKQEHPEVDLEKASRNVYESWMGGTMNDVRRDMVELGKNLNARKV